tara:strand:+ start:1058 stop:1510 length:453 start_codon:yes stop_codon:yes gene_type:complete
MAFSLSSRSLAKLEGVKPELVEVVKRAIELTKTDFGVIYGMRSAAEQQKLFDSGKSQTLKSKHLTGDAVDLMAYVDGKASWELNLYDDLADAMKWAATEKGVKIRWGAAWTVSDIAAWDGTMEAAMMSYIDTRRAESRRPFIDGPHFELN